MIATCQQCNSQFRTKPSHLKRGWGKYCSIGCRSLGQRRQYLYACYICNKAVWRTPKDLQKSKSKYYFCSKTCQTVWRNSKVYVGDKHPNWKTGVNSYRQIIARSSSERRCVLCQSTDPRVLAVHHIDKNRSNNSLANLAWLCHNCHFLVHHYDDELKRFMVAVA